MAEWGFERSQFNSEFRKTSDIKTLVHGDDFVSTGEGNYLKWLQGVLAGTFEISTVVALIQNSRFK